MKSFLKAALVILPLAVGTTVHAQIVNINAAVSGCADPSKCDGSPHEPPGTFIGVLLSPTQLILDAGTYTITNGSGLAGADPDFTAWRFNSGNNWVWSFMMIDDADKTLLVQGCCGTQVFGSQADAANDSFAQNYFTTFTLSATTTLDFITEDYFPADNAGGVALDIRSATLTTATPEPATLALLLPGLAVIGGLARRKRAAKK